MAGLWIAGLAAVSLVYFSFIHRLSRKRTFSRRSGYLQTTFEMTAVAVVVILDTQIDHAFALTAPGIHLLPVAIVMTGLRLDPWLSGYAGVLAAVLHIAFGFVLYDANVAATPALLPLFIGARSIFLVIVGLICAAIASSLRRLLVRSVRETEERLRVRSAFGIYVAEQVVERVLAGDLTPRTERRVITVLFADIRGFTRLSEGLDPEVLLSRLNQALEAFSMAVAAEGGIVNKYLGDGLMAIFGAPEDHEDHAARACRAALALRDSARELDESGRFAGLAIGVGVHTGEVVVGDVGGKGHREYTAIGDVVNVASRVESANKELGTDVLITQAVLEQPGVSEFEARELSPVTLRNRAEPVLVHHLLAAPAS
jgi:adenylate cyclase